MNTEAMKLISDMQNASTLDEAVTLQRRALAYTTQCVEPESSQAVARAGESMLKKMMTAHNRAN
jgi:hypothetical protein